MAIEPYSLLSLVTAICRELQSVDGTGAPIFTWIPKAWMVDTINEAQRDFVKQTRCLRATTALNLIGGQSEYDLSAISPAVLDVLNISAPTSTGGTDPETLIAYTLESIEKRDADWRTTVGAPEGFLRFEEGLQRVRIYPIPDGSYNALAGAPIVSFSSLNGIIGDVVGLTDATWTALNGIVGSVTLIYGGATIEYVAAATDMVNDNDAPVIPADFQIALREFACARLLLMDTPISQTKKGSAYMALYQAHVDRCKRLVTNGMQQKTVRTVRPLGF